MATLSSGLPEQVADEEKLARFLNSSGHYNSMGVKPAAFLPELKARETSVFRHGGETAHELWNLAEEHVRQPDGMRIHGAAIIPALAVREALLDVHADEPPPRHAAIRNWPWPESNPAVLKSVHKKMALQSPAALNS